MPAARFRRPTGVGWVVIATAIGALPVLVAVVALAQQTWHPIGDLAQSTLRMHSFWHHPPLVGTAGRIGTFENQGNHPGPAMFWVAWPLWRLLGGSAWAYQASVGAVAVAAYAGSVAVARRRGGIGAALTVALIGAVLMRSIGPVPLTSPWNPYLPLLPFLLFVLLAWATSCGDLRLLPATVAVGSFCVQCHVGYAPTIAAGCLVALGGPTLDGFRGRRGRGAEPPETAPDDLRRLVGWTALAALAGLVVWLPPIIDQLTHEPGNLTILVETYRAGTDRVIGPVDGLRILLTQLNPAGNWLLGTRTVMGSPLPGLALLAAWGVSVVAAWRRRHRALVRLDALLAVLGVCAFYWAVRLDSTRLLYLVEWFWILTALLVVATAWTAWIEWNARDGAATRIPHPSAALAVRVGAVALVLSTASFAWTARGIHPPDTRYSDTIGAIAGPTARDLDGLDPSGRYLVQWVDPVALGGNGFGLMLALEERGLRVGAIRPFRAAVEPHRVMDPADATAVVTVVSGPTQIANARRLPGVVEVAHHEHRTDAQQRQVAQRWVDAEAGLRRAGLVDLADGLHRSIWTALLDERTPGPVFDDLAVILEVGEATSVFVSDAPLPDLDPPR